MSIILDAQSGINMHDLPELFTAELPRLVDSFVQRAVQVELAQMIAEAMDASEHCILEAGTGIGKTLAYLVPALAGDKRIVVATGTRNLQDQLLGKDVPVIQSLFPRKRIVQLKGRANYLCPHRLKASLKTISDEGEMLHRLTSVRTWWSQTATGDINELLDPEENTGLLRLITSTRDNCLGGRCPDFDVCPLYRARKLAAEADLIVVNHHLLFADLAQKEENLAAILPQADAVIVDEAHRIPQVARQFFGMQISSFQLTSLIADVRAELRLLGNDDPVLADAASDLEARLDQLRQNIAASDEVDFNRWHAQNAGVAPSPEEDEVCRAAQVLQDVDLASLALGDELMRARDRSTELAQLLVRTERFIDLFALLTEVTDTDADFVHWIERRHHGFVIHLSPLSVGRELAAVFERSEACWIFISATLSTDGTFDHFRQEAGVVGGRSHIAASPFDYESAIRCWVPAGLPEPSSPVHTRRLVDWVIPLLHTNPGRSFMLFTSHEALRKAASCLHDSGLPLLVQGAMSRSRLLEAFRATPNAVLLGTQSFWEGIDVRGAGLKLVVIDKLPFPNPAEPVFRAQCDALESSGENSFTALSLPQMMLSLKQGFGRLMREESDRGLFVLGDGRLLTRQYGAFVRSNLPPMRWLTSAEDAAAWLREL